jgi:hypothetical protein
MLQGRGRHVLPAQLIMGNVLTMCLFVVALFLYAIISTVNRDVQRPMTNYANENTENYFISSLIRSYGGLAKAPGNMGASFMASVKHKSWNAVLDAGAFDGTDYTLPAYRAGYDVFTFEMSPENQGRVLASFKGSGLVEDTDFTIIRPVPGVTPQPPRRAAKQPHVYLFFAGVSSANRGMRMRYNLIMQGAAAAFELTGDSCIDTRPDCVPTVRIDDIIPTWAHLWIFKLDVQGHEPHAVQGAMRLLASGRVHSLIMEWWPAGIISGGIADGGVAALTALYDLGARCFDIGTTATNLDKAFGPDRPSALREWTDALLAVPRTKPPGGDIIGGWDDIICNMPLNLTRQ